VNTQLRTLALCAAAALAGCATTAPSTPPAQQAHVHHAYKPRPAGTQQAATIETAPPSGGYATGNPDQDGPPDPHQIPANLASIPDAVPKAETFSEAGNPEFYEVGSDRYYVLKDSHGFKERGVASWYGNKFQGRRTSSGEAYDMFRMTAAHKTLPIPCYVRVTNLRNGLSTVVRVNDRGPFHSGRIIDLSYAAALKIGVLDGGSAPVEIETVESAPMPAPPMIASAPLPVHAEMSAAPDPTPPARPTPVAAPAAAAVAAAPAPAAMAASAPLAAVPAAGAHYLQAGLFKDLDNAATLRAQLNGMGIVNVLLKTEARGADYVHRVLIGPFTDAQSLDDTRKHMADLQLRTVPVSE
jgi:peptidoglycan lytic transglycosylase